MARQRQLTELPQIRLNPAHPLPLSRQLEQQMRKLIVSGGLPSGTRLPSSRQIAGSLDCSRSTVIIAMDQLTAEGLLVCKERSGTFVRPALAAKSSDLQSGAKLRTASRRAEKLSSIGELLLNAPSRVFNPEQAFSAGSPDVRSFPFDIWSRLCRRHWRRPPRESVYCQDPAGYLPLRRAIASYLHGTRGVSCKAEDVMITSGAQQALDLCARLLLDPRDRVWVEEPGFLEARYVLEAARARIVPLPVDREGIVVSRGRRIAPGARMAIVSPSHQYPLGVIMSFDRRLELLDWARKAGAWILEDDYCSDFRHAGAPLPALRALDEGERVIYTGTFSKAMFSSLRLGYLVLPPALTEKFCRARYRLDPYASTAMQPVLARFMEEGHFSTHMHRMRRQFAARREAVIAYGSRYCAGMFEFVGDKAGLHVVAEFSKSFATRMSDREAAQRAMSAAVVTSPLSGFYLGRPQRQGLLLGFPSITEKQIEEGMRTLARVLEVAG